MGPFQFQFRVQADCVCMSVCGGGHTADLVVLRAQPVGSGLPFNSFAGPALLPH